MKSRRVLIKKINNNMEKSLPFGSAPTFGGISNNAGGRFQFPSALSEKNCAEQVPNFKLPFPLTEQARDSICELGSVKFGSDDVQYSWTIMKHKIWPNVGEVRSPTFWHTKSTEWLMALSVEEGNWYLCFHLLFSQRKLEERGTVRALLLVKGDYNEVYKDVVLIDTAKVTKKICIITSDKSDDFFHAIKLIGIVSIASVIMQPSKDVDLPAETESILKDFETLLDSGEYSDIVLCAGGTQFKAHKAVLAARCPLLASMLRHNTEEPVAITDVDPDTLRDLLRYIYTGSTPRSKNVEDKLLAAAHKYGLKKLKECCEIELSRKITVENAVSIATIALECSCESLKVAVINFIKQNILQVMSSDGWADSVTKNSKIVVEISNLLADKPIKNDRR